MKVSIITASFNSASTIVDTIRSVLAQTYPDIEYWVIDGGSSDRTLEIVREYESQFKGRLHYVSEKDRGIYDAMNKGIGKSTGEVVGILNSDDYFTDAYVVENVVRVLSDNKTLDALKKNKNITLLTLEKLCDIIGCTPNDIVSFKK